MKEREVVWGELKNKQKPDEPGRIIQRDNFPGLTQDKSHFQDQKTNESPSV